MSTEETAPRRGRPRTGTQRKSQTFTIDVALIAFLESLPPGERSDFANTALWREKDLREEKAQQG